jgi:hypothetical protein
VRFVYYDFFEGTDDLLDPASVTGTIYKWNTTTSLYETVGPITPIVQESLGIYYYNWTPPQNGLFRLLFVGTLPGATPSQVENQRDFFIGTSVPSITLGSTATYYFLGELDPLYLDPERILAFYPDANLVEVTEIIYRLSSELITWFGPNLIFTPLMEEWMIASVLCELTKIYFLDGGMSGLALVNDFTLGDLQVSSGSGTTYNNKSGDRGNVSTWCELAALLRGELLFSRTGMKAIVKGSNYANPIPPRALRRFE